MAKRYRIVRVALPLAVAMLGGICWLATLRQPQYVFFPIPSDVGLALRSHGGQLAWIEFIHWKEPPEDWVVWSLPWWGIEVALLCGALIGIRLGGVKQRCEHGPAANQS
jgi:hypothetical protein